MAQAAGHPSEAAKAVRRLREMQFRGYEPPAFGPGNFGEVFDRMVEGRGSWEAEERTEVLNVALPNVIRISINPYRAILVWTPDKKKPWANTYTPDVSERPLGSNFLFKETLIHPKLVELAWQVPTEPMPETKNATPGRVAPLLDQSTAHTADKSDDRNSDPTPRCVSVSTQEIDTETEFALCPQLSSA